MMQYLQIWFERIVGVAEYEHQRMRQVREVFRKRELPAGIELPACWRRQVRITRLQRA